MDPHHFGQLDKVPHPSEEQDPDLHQRDPRPTKKIISWLGCLRIRIHQEIMRISPDTDPDTQNETSCGPLSAV